MRARAMASVGMAAPVMTGLGAALCAWEVRRARSEACPFVDALPGSGPVGSALRGDVLRITWLGDSLAAGLGCDHLDDTPARLSARMLERPVEVRVLAVPGARTIDVLEQQLPLVTGRTDLVVLCVGANDVASCASRSTYARRVDEILARLAPTLVVMLTLPDMAMPDRMAEPLRSVAGARARWFEAARARVASRHPHVASVDIASRPPGLSRRAGRELLCADRFHPGPQGYRLWAERIAAACDALLSPEPAAAARPGAPNPIS